MGGVHGRRPLRWSPRSGAPSRLAGAVAALLLIVGCAGPAPAVPPVASWTPVPSSGAAPAATPAEASTSGPAPTGQPAGNEAWAPVQPAGLPQAATLVPTRGGADVVARTTGFLLTSLDGRPAASLAGRIVADPPVAFRVTPSGAAAAVLQPTAVLAAATRYHLSLTRPDGTVEASWTALTAGPLHVSDTVPGDQATSVPLDTGIEVNFDQPGVTASALASHFRISPAVKGHFEADGRSVAFAPDKPLAKATLYTVTITRGLPIAGTGEALEQDVTIRFETAAARPWTARVWLPETLVDATPRELAAMTLWWDVQGSSSRPTSVPLRVHRLGSLDGAISAWAAISRAPAWTLASTQAAVATSSLPQVLSASVPIQGLDDGTPWIQLPRTLAAGWYVVTVAFAGVPRQLVLQVTDTATYALVTSTQTAVWVNDLKTRGPAMGATASLAGTVLAGATDARGLLVAASPPAVAGGDATDPMLLVHYGGSTTFRPVAGGSMCGGCDGTWSPRDSLVPDTWWTMLTTDRWEYRQTDTVNAVGVVRQRVSGTVPASVLLELVRNDGADAVTILTRTATPDARGMYSASLQIAGLPVGGYRLRASVDGASVGETWLSVATIRKPAYLITVMPERHAVISGQPLQATVSAAFFDGTPAAGTQVQLTTEDSEAPQTTVTTDAGGLATGTLKPKAADMQQRVATIGATPTLPEEAGLAANNFVAVFAGSAFLSLDGSANGKTLTVTGGVNTVDWGRYDQPDVDLWSIDPRGAARPGAAVQIKVVARSMVQRQTGTAYDFITKRVMPRYEYTDNEVALASRSVRTGADGTFRLTLPAGRNAYAYSVTATYVDEAGRRIETEAWISGTAPRADYPIPSLDPAEGHDYAHGYSVGDTVRVRFSGGAPRTTATRYLYLALQQGLRGADVSSSAEFQTTFTDASIPDIAITAVRFNGSGYDAVPWPYTARLDQQDRQLTVTMAADKLRYEPGESATVSVSTADRDGRPVAASVFVRAVDEKLFAMGAAAEGDPLAQLYADVPTGVVGSVRSHQPPEQGWGGGRGDTTGGGGTGGRTDFRDWLVAKVVHTDAAGRATVTVPLSDDLTSWRVAATAVDGALDAGAASIKIPVGLPFFVDAVLASEYLASDRPVLRVRSYGTALRAGDRVAFAVTSDTLPMAEVTVTADAFGSAYVPLPALAVGTQRVRIAGSVVASDQTLQDAMTRTFTVIASRATQQRTTWSLLAGPTTVQAGQGMTRLALVDSGRGRVVPVLEELAASGAARADQVLASGLATRVLAHQFGLAPATTSDPNALDTFTSNGGLSIVPWGAMQLDVTALAAMTGDPRLAMGDIRERLRMALDDDAQPRAGRILALAGLAALGEPVHGDISTLDAATDLTVEERADLALAALEAGDEALAGRLEQQLLASNALRSANMVRIDPGPGTDTTVVTARLAIVAASLGDPIAAEMDEYLAANPPKTTLVVLERALAARGWAMRVASSTARATLTVDGVRTAVSLSGGDAAGYMLTPAQARSASVAPVAGSLLLVQTWDGALEPSSLAAPNGITFTRDVSPAGVIPGDRTVVVTFHVSIPPTLRASGWRIVDVAPSGLAPVLYCGAWADPQQPAGVISPDSIDGQRVELMVGWDPRRSEYWARYVAHVVSPGSYTWEPSVLQSLVDPASGLTVPATTVTISTPVPGG